MCEQVYYTIDSFDIDTSAVNYGIVGHRFAKRGRKPKRGTIDETIIYDTVCFELPDYFVESRNPNKSVEFQLVHCLIKDADGTWNYLPATMHSDVVQYRSSADSYVCSTEVMYTQRKHFYIPNTQKSFDLWFRDMNGDILDMTPTTTRVIIELLLTY